MGLVAQWITRLTTDQEIPGSNPGELEIFMLPFELATSYAFYLKTGIPVISFITAVCISRIMNSDKNRKEVSFLFRNGQLRLTAISVAWYAQSHSAEC